MSLSRYESQVACLLDGDQRSAMEFFVASSPEDHPVIPGSGGFRKARWALPGKGKSGGFRIIYYFISPPGRVYMASIFAKSRRENLSMADRNLLVKLAAAIKEEVRGRS